MKKVIITDQFKQHLDPEFFIEFADVELVTAYSNDQALWMHRDRKADLIITELYGVGMNTVQFCSQLREDEGMRGVSIIVYCRDNEMEIRESARCRANTVMKLPVNRALLRETMQRFLSVPPRRTVRTTFSVRRSVSADVNIDCLMENISMTGMLFESGTNLQKGEKLYCTLTLPSLPPIVTQAEVIRTGKEKSSSNNIWYGVKFSGLDPAAQRAIERIVSHAPQAGR